MPEKDEVAMRAEARGHSVEADPTFTGNERWTCTKCGRAVLRYAGNVYGSAIETDCTGNSDWMRPTEVV